MGKRKTADSFGPIDQPGPKAWHRGLDQSGWLAQARKSQANYKRGLHKQGKMDFRRGLPPQGRERSYMVGYKAAGGKWQTPVSHAHSGGGKGGWNEADHPRNADGEFTNK